MNKSGTTNRNISSFVAYFLIVLYFFQYESSLEKVFGEKRNLESFPFEFRTLVYVVKWFKVFDDSLITILKNPVFAFNFAFGQIALGDEWNPYPRIYGLHIITGVLL